MQKYYILSGAHNFSSEKKNEFSTYNNKQPLIHNKTPTIDRIIAVFLNGIKTLS